MSSRLACLFEAFHDQVQSGNTAKQRKITQNQNDSKIQCIILGLRFSQSCNYRALLTRPEEVGLLHTHPSAMRKPTSTQPGLSTRNALTLPEFNHFLKSHMIKASLEWTGIKEEKSQKSKCGIWLCLKLRAADFLSHNPPPPQRDSQHTSQRLSVPFPMVLNPRRGNQ